MQGLHARGRRLVGEVRATRPAPATVPTSSGGTSLGCAAARRLADRVPTGARPTPRRSGWTGASQGRTRASLQPVYADRPDREEERRRDGECASAEQNGGNAGDAA